jgi:hypothetical protein
VTDPTSDPTEADGPVAPPVLSVVRGHPTDEELAAVLTVLSSLSSGAAESARPKEVSGWAAYWRAARAPLSPGPGAWRASAR